MRRTLGFAVAVLSSLAACGGAGSSSSPADAAALTAPARAAPVAAQSERRTRFLTRNLYLGADIDPVVAVVAGGATQEQLLAATTSFWQIVKASDPPARMAAIADEIAAEEPDLVGLQEASLWRTGPFDPAAPAEEVAYDFVALLVAELRARGLAYEVAAASTNFDAELPVLADPANPAAGLLDVRMTDRDAILARAGAGVHVLASAAGNYAARLPLGGLSVPRGWASADVKHEGAWFRFVSTHLEVNGPGGAFTPVQEAQAAELAALLAEEPLPVVLAGDFNSNASGGPTSRSYAILRAAGFGDLWAAVHPDDAGLTCCQSELLRDVGPFSERIDLLLYRGPWAPLHATLVGAEPFRAPDGVHVVWGSDHAGVAGALRPLFAGRGR